MRLYRYSEAMVREILHLKGVPVELHEEAVASIKAGWDKASSLKCKFGSWSAPLIVPIALCFTPWEADELPKAFSWYNNDHSINGDRYRWTEKGAEMPVSLDPDDEWAKEGNYYNKGVHPRAFSSRYIWLGIRNRAKVTYEIPLDFKPSREMRMWGEDVTRGGEGDPTMTGWVVEERDGFWAIRGVHPLPFGFYQEPRWGWKIGVMFDNGEYFGKNKVMSVGINYKMRRPSKD